MAITLRSVKGSALTHAEVDQNFIDLRDLPDGKTFPSASNIGIKVDTTTPDWPWHDLIGHIFIDEGDPGNAAVFSTYQGTMKVRQFVTEQTDEAYINFHVPHDYVEGTEMFIHAHWSHTNTNVSGGSVTWGFDVSYAKGHNRGAFSAPVTISVADTANTTQYTHKIAEGPLTTAGGSNVSLDSNLIEPDGIIHCRVFLDSNDMTVSSNTVPAPFIHAVDIHYQSKVIGTKSRSPDFYN